VLRGAHPYPDEEGEASARRLLAEASRLGAEDLLIVLLSGGGSALLAAPAEGLTLQHVHATTRALLRSGATIEAVNTVRRQLLAAAGGGLAAAAAPATIETLVLSDVLGDPLPAIASGPTVPSPTTARDAVEVLARHGVRDSLPRAVLEVLERRSTSTSGRPAWSERSRLRILANNRTAVDAAAWELEGRGFQTIIHSGHVEGEASARGRQLAALARALRPRRSTAFVLGGETTVTVTGAGRGGRNHELTLAAAIELAGTASCVLLSAGTDGMDGLADAAGAVVDPGTAERLVRAGIDPQAALAENDSGTALGAVDATIVTGPTGTNVCDLMALLVAGRG
jgi:glycerate-2-kinase